VRGFEDEKRALNLVAEKIKSSYLQKMPKNWPIF
jgi:hypothetical protein